TAPPDPSRSGTIPYGSACACRRTRRRRRSSASWKNSAGGIGVFHQIREVFFRPSLAGERGAEGIILWGSVVKPGAQRVIHNAGVRGSSPCVATIFKKGFSES